MFPFLLAAVARFLGAAAGVGAAAMAALYAFSEYGEDAEKANKRVEGAPTQAAFSVTLMWSPLLRRRPRHLQVATLGPARDSHARPRRFWPLSTKRA